MKYIVTEQMIAAAAKKCGPDSNFYKVLRSGEEFKSAGLTPKYIYHATLDVIEITTEEKYKNKLN